MRGVLERERSRADRNHSGFALVLFTFDGDCPSPRALARLARSVSRRARATDAVGWFDRYAVGAVLPHTAAPGAWRFADDVCLSLRGVAPPVTCRVFSYPSDSPGGGNVGDEAVREVLTGRAPQARAALGGDAEGDAGVATAVSPAERGTARLREDGDSNPIGRDDLLPAFLSGLAVGMRGCGADQPPRRSAESLATLLVKPLPLWKRAIDVTGAGAALICLLPVLAVVGFAVKLSSPGPMIFHQPRTGRGGRPFTMAKFRTMVVDAEARQEELRQHSEQDGPAFKMTNDPRVTRLGRFLRMTSLDELPQLWNVLKGDMSLVGPRPLPCREASGCEPWHQRRLDVTPGITCLWQVKGRSRVSFAEWMRMDIGYIRRQHLLYDVALLLLTVPAVLLRRGAR